MEKTLNQSAVIDEVLNIYQTFDPVEGYAAGLNACAGKIFIPRDAAVQGFAEPAAAIQVAEHGIG